MNIVRRTAAWIGHRTWWIWAAYLVLGFVLDIIVKQPENTDHPWWGALVPAVMAGVLIACWAHHDESLCPDCLMGMPLNPEQATERRGWVLRGFHRFGTWHRYMMIGGLAVLGAALSWFDVLDPWMEVLYLPFVGLTIAGVVHRKYEPWCPQCRDDGGDDDIEFQSVGPGGHGAKEPLGDV